MKCSAKIMGKTLVGGKKNTKF